LLDLEFTIRFV